MWLRSTAVSLPLRVCRHLWLALSLVAVLGLSGCAATSITSQVQSFGAWPAARKPGSFVFDVLPSQQAEVAVPGQVTQANLQAAALPALQALGFALASPADMAARQSGLNGPSGPDGPDVLVQLALQVSLTPRMPVQPFMLYAPYSLYGPYSPFPVVSPYPRRGIRWQGGIWGPNWVAMEPPWVTLRVDLILRDRRSSQVLYETHAVHDSLGAVDESAIPYLFEAALQGFPDAPPGPRVVSIPLPHQEAR